MKAIRAHLKGAFLCRSVRGPREAVCSPQVNFAHRTDPLCGRAMAKAVRKKTPFGAVRSAFRAGSRPFPGSDAHDAPEGRAPLTDRLSLRYEYGGGLGKDLPLVMDRAYEGDETRQSAIDAGMGPVAPPKANRPVKWDYDRTVCKRRNEVERPFRRLKGYRRIFSHFEKLDVMYRAFLNCALIVKMIKY